MKKFSAGILMYRFNNKSIEVLLVHPGGPFYQNKDLGVWSIPKGEFIEGEEARDAAIREFREELGFSLHGDMAELSPVIQKNGKKVFAWAIEGNLDPGKIVCNTFPLEWPPRSGQIKEFPEIDKGEWFPLNEARIKIIEAQAAFIDELVEILKK